MTASLGSLVVSLEANIAKFTADMGRAAVISELTMKRIEERSQLTADAMRKLGGIVAGAFAANALKSFAERTIEGTAALKDMAEKTGASVERLSALRSVATAGGKDMDAIANAMVKLTRNLSGTEDETKAAGAALAALGIPIEQFKRLDPAAQLELVANRMIGFKDGAGKTAVALDLFGKAGADLLPYLKDLAEAGVINAKVTREQAEQADELQKNIRRIERASDEVKKKLVVNMVPALVEITGAMREAAKESGLLMALWVGLGGLFAKSTIGQMLNADGADSGRRALEEQRVKVKQLGDALTENIRLAAEGDARAQARLPKIRAELEKQIAAAARMSSAIKGELDPPKAAERAELKYDGKAKREKTALAEDPGLQLLNRLKSEYEHLSGAVSKETEAERAIDAMRKQVTPEREKEILAVARQIDQRARSKVQLEEETKALEAYSRRQEEVSNAIADGFAALVQHGKEIGREAELLGLTAEASQKLLFARRVDADLRKVEDVLLQAVNDGLMTQADATHQVAAATQKANEAKQAFAELQQKEIDLAARWETGAARAIYAYQKSVRDVATQTEQAFSNAFQSMEDALVNFVQTGKLDFKSLVNSILADLVRIQVRQSFMLPLSQGLGQGMGVGVGSGPQTVPSFGANLFATIGNWASSLLSFDVGTPYVPRDMIARIHEGERIVPKAENLRGERGGNTFNVVQNFTVGDVASMAQVRQAVEASKREIFVAHERSLKYGGAA